MAWYDIFMITLDEIEKLAALSRLELQPDEKEKLRADIDSILAYVGEIKRVTTGEAPREIPENRNIFREDAAPHESGIYTEELLSLAPNRQGDYVKVKKIL